MGYLCTCLQKKSWKSSRWAVVVWTSYFFETLSGTGVPGRVETELGGGQAKRSHFVSLVHKLQLQLFPCFFVECQSESILTMESAGSALK
jgi:hypothetical protein